jgi:hypothetical protein
MRVILKLGAKRFQSFALRLGKALSLKTKHGHSLDRGLDLESRF